MNNFTGAESPSQHKANGMPGGSEVALRAVLPQLPEHAQTLLGVCDYLRSFLQTVKVAEPTVQNVIREMILPYVRDAIDRATKQ
jgi:hypothetical protein